MVHTQINNPVPDFISITTGNKKIQLSQLKSQRVLLFFYPKNNTPSSIIENQDFSANYDNFLSRNTQVFGISRDSLDSHEEFKKELNIPFDLISDTNESLCHLFNVLTQKELFGQSISTLDRSSFLIDEEGILIYEWRNISIKEHVHQALAILDSMDAVKLTDAN